MVTLGRVAATTADSSRQTIYLESGMLYLVVWSCTPYESHKLPLKRLHLLLMVGSGYWSHSSCQGLIQANDWIGLSNLKDAYIQIPIHQECQHLLWFQGEHKLYQFQHLPVGLHQLHGFSPRGAYRGISSW